MCSHFRRNEWWKLLFYLALNSLSKFLTFHLKESIWPVLSNLIAKSFIEFIFALLAELEIGSLDSLTESNNKRSFLSHLCRKKIHFLYLLQIKFYRLHTERIDDYMSFFFFIWSIYSICIYSIFFIEFQKDG